MVRAAQGVKSEMLSRGQVPAEIIFVAPARVENHRAPGGLALFNELAGLGRGNNANVSRGKGTGGKKGGDSKSEWGER